jgi:hypothetical protein
MSIKNEQFISIDTNQVLMEEADKLMEEYEQQKIDQLRARVKELEASNKDLLTLLCDIDEELSLAQADAIETGNITGSSLPANLIIRLRWEINKAKGVQG